MAHVLLKGILKSSFCLQEADTDQSECTIFCAYFLLSVCQFVISCLADTVPEPPGRVGQDLIHILTFYILARNRSGVPFFAVFSTTACENMYNSWPATHRFACLNTYGEADLSLCMCYDISFQQKVMPRSLISLLLRRQFPGQQNWGQGRSR